MRRVFSPGLYLVCAKLLSQEWPLRIILITHSGLLISVQDEVLNDENDVEDDADIGKTQFQRVASNAAPVTLKASIDDQLKQGQHPSSDVE